MYRDYLRIDDLAVNPEYNDYPDYFGLFLYVVSRTKQIQWTKVSQTQHL